MRQETNNINNILDQNILELTKVNLKKNEFYYRTIDSNINLNFGIFGKEKVPCIGLCLNNKFLEYKIENKYKTISLMNAPSPYGERILILLNNNDKIEIFKKLYNWLHQDLVENKNLINSFEDLCKYVEEYSKFFEVKIQNFNSKDSLLGLYGELDLLNQLLQSKKYNKREVIDSWSGYQRSTHDFNFHNMKIEVKSSTSDNNLIHCSSYNQLISQTNSNIYLIKFSYEEKSKEESGTNIFDLIDLIKGKLKISEASFKVFERKLEIFGINKINDFTKYKRKSYNIYEIRHDFPSFKNINIHPSISGIKYKIDLSMCDEWLVPLSINEF